ncbi:hypothetical protein ACH5RR_017473 [Cinchona calisaya]|uniref:Cystatin domain-containing protein n=1 Tax=Cinchona calisaya TaxID=153742 RepID=A0ABD2ZJG8_9GENT
MGKDRPKGPEAIEIAKFAIHKHNNEAKTKLQFESLVKAEKQVVEGINYRIGINALDGTTSKIEVEKLFDTCKNSSVEMIQHFKGERQLSTGERASSACGK